jgi:glycosyltransferase involved in cell wall biosynthesis
LDKPGAASDNGASIVTQHPSVTIAIPTYNRLSFLRQTLDSALSQTYSNLQVIASDNASDDGTTNFLASIRDPRFKFVTQKTNVGMLRNWNACLEHAQSDFFLLLSDDDYLDKSAIEKLVNAFMGAQQPEKVGVAYCRTWEVDRAGIKQSLDPRPVACEDATEFAIEYFGGNRKMHPCSTLVRTSDLREIGGYEQGSVVLAVDAIVWSRILMKRGWIAAVAEPLSNYRIHPGSETSSQRIDIWRNDIATLIKLWADFFQDQLPELQHQFQRAAAHYLSWELAAIINQSAKSFAARLRALGLYYRCRNEFMGATGSINLAGGLTKLFLPEILKRPLRKLRLQAAQD